MRLSFKRLWLLILGSYLAAAGMVFFEDDFFDWIAENCTTQLWDLQKNGECGRFIMEGVERGGFHGQPWLPHRQKNTLSDFADWLSDVGLPFPCWYDNGIPRIDGMTPPPAVQWERIFQSYDTWVRRVEQTSDGGFVAAGSVSPARAEHNTYILRTDSQGSTLWQRSIDAGEADFVSFVQQTEDGGFVFAGGNGDSAKVMVLKTDSLGNQQWKFSAFPGAAIYTVQQTSDGGYITGGLWWKHDSLYLLKLDSLGNFAWRKSFNEFYGHWNAHIPVRQTSDGGYIVAAEVLLKTDSLGNQVWKRKYSDVLVLFSVQETQDGGFVAAGIARAPWPLGRTKPFNMVLLKTSSSGNTQWKKVFTEGNESDGRCAGLTSDGGFVVSGSVTLGRFDRARVWRTDSQGNLIWTKTFEEQTGLVHGKQTLDGGYILSHGEVRISKLAAEQ